MPGVTAQRQVASQRRLRYLGFGFLAVVTVGALWVLGPRLATPPRTITMATGPEGGAYAELGPRYREILARDGIQLRLLPTGGDVENLAKLGDPNSEVSVAFVEAGIASPAQANGLFSLGTLMYSPLWVFERGDRQVFGLADIAGKHLSIGPEGSGTNFQVRKLLELVGVDPKSLRLEVDPPEEGERALLSGQIDALAINASWEAPVVRQLLRAPQIWLVSFPRADAYVALDPYLTKLVLPMGVGDLAKNLPSADITLIATKTSLYVRKTLHPALQYLLLEAASEIHSGPALFQRAGEFPAAEPLGVPLSQDARNFHKSGAPFLHRYLPFWLAVLVERLLILLIPLVGLLFPVLQVLPEMYYRAMERRVLALYGELKLLEADADRLAPGKSSAELVVRIDQLDNKASRLRVPMKFTQSLYHLKEHINFVRRRLTLAETRPEAPG
ncbi:MAG: TAXI family TRAP transporter solute-binding subunit [Myxococcaceae bacterium]